MKDLNGRQSRVTDPRRAAVAKTLWSDGQRSRVCPKCNSIVEYKDKWSYIYAHQNNGPCKTCTTLALCHRNKINFLGRKNPFYGRHHTNKTKKY
jgi:hypothetical protein